MWWCIKPFEFQGPTLLSCSAKNGYRGAFPQRILNSKRLDGRTKNLLLFMSTVVRMSKTYNIPGIVVKKKHKAFPSVNFDVQLR